MVDNTHHCFRALNCLRSGVTRTVTAALIGSGTIALATDQAEARDRIFSLTPFADATDDWRTRQIFTGQTLTFYGQLSPIALQYDDGAVRDTYAPIGNSNKTSRVGFRYQIRSFGAWSPVFRVEFGLSARPSNSVNLLDPGESILDFNSQDLRKFELVLTHPTLGKIAVGQGSMATDNIAEVDYSGTTVAAYSNVAQVAAAQFLRREDGTLSAFQVGSFIDNFDGDSVRGSYEDGTRKMRVRYDTPNYEGFVLSMALGNEAFRDEGEVNADVSVTHEADLGDVRVASGIGYRWQTDTQILSGSASVFHEPTGVSLTGAFGYETDGGEYDYLKLGLRRQIWAIGDTAVSVDWYQSKDISVSGSSAKSLGLAFVQSFDKAGLQGYALVRRYKFDLPTVSFQDGLAVMTGLRWAF